MFSLCYIGANNRKDETEVHNEEHSLATRQRARKPIPKSILPDVA